MNKNLKSFKDEVQNLPKKELNKVIKQLDKGIEDAENLQFDLEDKLELAKYFTCKHSFRKVESYKGHGSYHNVSECSKCGREELK